MHRPASRSFISSRGYSVDLRCVRAQSYEWEAARLQRCNVLLVGQNAEKRVSMFMGGMHRHETVFLQFQIRRFVAMTISLYVPLPDELSRALAGGLLLRSIWCLLSLAMLLGQINNSWLVLHLREQGKRCTLVSRLLYICYIKSKRQPPAYMVK